MSTLRCALLGILAVAAACEQPPALKADDAGVQDAGTKTPGMEQLGDVAKSLEGREMSPEDLAKQPPVGGIFAPGIADKAHAPGAPPALAMIDEGIEPRIALHAASFEANQVLGMQLELKIQGQAVGSRIVLLEVGPPRTEPEPPKEDPKDPKRPKTPATATPKGSAAPPAPELPPGADRPLVVMVSGLSPQGQPDDFRAVIAFTMTKAGPTDFKHRLAAGGSPNTEKAMLYELELSAIEELLSAFYTPAPPKPVGEKAMWMVTDRRSSFGSDVVRYRAFTVTKIDGDRAFLNLEMRQYAANDTSALIADAEIAMGSYNSLGKGQLDVIPKLHFPKSGQLKIVVGSKMVPKKAKDEPNAPGKPLNFEAVVQIGEIQMRAADGAPGGKPGEKGPEAPGKRPGKPPRDPGQPRSPAPQPDPPPAPAPSPP